MKTLTVNQFNGGMVNDSRDPRENVTRVATNFDILTNQYRMTPYRRSESGDSGASTSKKENFVIALGTGTEYRLYGLGVVSGTGRAEILMKTLGTGGSGDLSDATWLTPANNAAASGTVNFDLFVYYRYTTVANSRIFGASTNRIWSYDPTSTAAFDDAGRAINYTNIAQGLVHSKDDILYIPYDNKIAKNNQGVWTDAAITIPSHLYITSICETGNFLAIAAAPLSGNGASRVYLWDRDSSLTTLSENIYWGEGIIKVLEDIDGFLIGISFSGGNSTRFNDRIVFRYWQSGPSGIEFESLIGTTSSIMPIAKQKVNNRIYFMLSANLNGSVREGVWSIGRSSANSAFGIIHERTPNNSTALSSGLLNNFFLVGDFMFISYVDSSVYYLSKTDDQASYSATSIYESTINPKMTELDKMSKKQLVSVTAHYVKLPSAGQVVMKYKVDGGSYTTIFTEIGTDTVNPVFTETTIDASGTQFTSGREYEFRLESTGGAEITGFSYKYSTLSTLI